MDGINSFIHNNTIQFRLIAFYAITSTIVKAVIIILVTFKLVQNFLVKFYD